MKVGIMQPYFFPYIGYWQLINAVDKYVIYDDVNFIKRGWIHRNRILFEGKPKYFNLPLLGASQNKLINQIKLNPEKKLKDRNLQILKEAYKRAPHFKAIYSILEDIILCDEENLAKYLYNSIKIICENLGITTELIVSSELEKDCSLKGKDKIISICILLGATSYYNAIGGQDLYSYSEFQKRGIKLHFIKTNEIEYNQDTFVFQKNLSIIDLMMYNSTKEIRKILEKYTLL